MFSVMILNGTRNIPRYNCKSEVCKTETFDSYDRKHKKNLLGDRAKLKKAMGGILPTYKVRKGPLKDLQGP